MIRLTKSRNFYLTALIFQLVVLSSSVHGFEIVDNDGISHHFESPAQRIISLYPAHTENLAAIGASSVLIGISTSDTYPRPILDKPKFSYHDSLEKFIEADPDCILIRPMIARSNPNLIKKLSDYGISVISLQPTSMSGLYEYWLTLGRISGFENGAVQLVNKFQNELKEIRKEVDHNGTEARPKVYFESIHSRMRTFSPESISIFCLTTAGGINIADDAVDRRGTNIAGYSKERILAKADEIDVFLAQSGRMNRITVKEIINEPGFGAIKAVRNNKVYLVDEHLVSRPTTRLLLGVRQLQQYLHPTNLQSDNLP